MPPLEPEPDTFADLLARKAGPVKRDGKRHTSRPRRGMVRRVIDAIRDKG